MDDNQICGLLFLFSFYILAILFFLFYVLFAIKTKRKVCLCDFIIFLVPYVSWGIGFYLSDKYGGGFGLGKTLGNIQEIFLIGIFVFLYVITKMACIVYAIHKGIQAKKDYSWFFLGIIALLSLLVGFFVPGMPE